MSQSARFSDFLYEDSDLYRKLKKEAVTETEVKKYDEKQINNLCKRLCLTEWEILLFKTTTRMIKDEVIEKSRIGLYQHHDDNQQNISNYLWKLYDDICYSLGFTSNSSKND